MKITGFKMYQVPPRWLFLKIETDEGICGWGEPVLEGKADTVAACVDEMMDYLIGRRYSLQRYFGDRAGVMGYQGEILQHASI